MRPDPLAVKSIASRAFAVRQQVPFPGATACAAQTNGPCQKPGVHPALAQRGLIHVCFAIAFSQITLEMNDRPGGSKPIATRDSLQNYKLAQLTPKYAS